jgi:transposase InsO family protein
MDEEKKKQIAIFRFGVISDFVSPARLQWGERKRLLQDKCAREWQIPFSGRTRLSPATILSWIRAYERSGRKLEAIYPRSRSDRGLGRALDDETALALTRLRQEMPTSTVRSLIRAAQQRRLVDPETHLAECTVWRLLKREGLMHREHAPTDRRRFEAELPNDIWQSDVMHGPTVRVEGKNRKAYLIAFIDDMSRLICHAQFYLSENLDSYLDCLRQALLTRGLPRKLYVDNGPAFRSLHLKQICASLGIALIHSKPYQPQGRGKVERFFRTVRTDFLPGVRAENLTDLNEAFDTWLRSVYHNRPHRSTGQTPLKRFAAHSECLRAASKDLEDHFRRQARRRVAKDRTVALGGRLYEAPIALIGQQITLLYHAHDPARVEALHEGKSYGMLRIVDVNVNCRVQRENNNLTLHSEPRPLSGGQLPFVQRKEEK